MAYVTGQVNDIASLLTAIIDACTTNGWTLNTNVLSKGGVFVALRTDGTRVLIRGGLGIDGSDNLTTPGFHEPGMSSFEQPITFPLTYEVHVNTDPDEVYVLINYSVEFWLWMAWGQSDVAGLPGAGVWYAASKGKPSEADTRISNPFGGSLDVEIPWLFAWEAPGHQYAGSLANSFIHHGLDGKTWNYPNTAGDPNQTQPNAWEPATPLQHIQPNAWNHEALLVPIQAWMRRPEDKVSLVADLRHARYTRIDFLDPGDIITLGPDQWKVYPWYRKDTSDRDALGSGLQHTGTYGFAVRYTGS